MVAAGRGLQAAGVQRTAGQLAGTDKARAQLADVMKRWTALKVGELGKVNAKRKAAGQSPIALTDN